MPAPCFSLDEQTRELKGEMLERIGDVIDANGFANGLAVARFEEDLARYLGIGHVVCVNSGTVVPCGVTIGRNSMIGAGAVVTRDVPDGGVVAGVPARVMARSAASR